MVKDKEKWIEDIMKAFECFYKNMFIENTCNGVEEVLKKFPRR